MPPAPSPHLEPVGFDALNGFADDNAAEAFAAFTRVGAGDCRRRHSAARRPPRFRRSARRGGRGDQARRARSRPGSRILPPSLPPFSRRAAGKPAGIPDRLLRTPRHGFAATLPGLFRTGAGAPHDLVSFAPGDGPAGFDPTLAGGRRRADGTWSPTRRALRSRPGSRPALIWLEDAVEVFLIQVQGSARVELPDGRRMRLVYDGRNGRPYTSIGRLLGRDRRHAAGEMSLARLKGWLRAHGLQPGERGRELMQRNPSYIFFRLRRRRPCVGSDRRRRAPLTPLRSIAVDRTPGPMACRSGSRPTCRGEARRHSRSGG